MELTAKPVATTLVAHAVYKEIMLDLLREDRRFPLIIQFLKVFDLRLNNLRFGSDTPSDNYIHFSKFYGPTFCDVAFGLEESKVSMTAPQDLDQVRSVYGMFFQAIQEVPLATLRMTISHQLEVNGDVSAFLRSLNPNVPSPFAAHLVGGGVYFNLKMKEHDLTIFITAVSSLLVQGGLYLSIENVFSPSRYDFMGSLKIAADYYDYILNGLNIKIQEGVACLASIIFPVSDNYNSRFCPCL